MKFKTILFLLFVVTFSAIAQKTNFDSLYSVYNNSKKHDSSRLKALYLIGNALQKKYPDSASAIIKKALAEAIDKKVVKMEGLCYNTLGMICKDQAQYFEAIDYLTKCINLEDKIGDKKALAKAYIGLGQVYGRMSDYKKALMCYFKNIKIFDELNEPDSKIAAYLNIGNIYFRLSKYREALSYYNQCYSICIRTDKKEQLALVLQNKSITYNNLNIKDSAEILLRQGLKISEEFGFDNLRAKAYSTIANNHYMDHEYDSCILFYKRSLEVGTKINDKQILISTRIKIARALVALKKLNEAKKIIDEALVLIEGTGELGYEMDCYGLLAQINKSLKNYEASVYDLEKYSELKDSMVLLQSKTDVMEMGYQYAYQKKNLADSLKLNEEKRVINLELKQEKTRMWALLAVLILFAVFGVFIFNRYRVTQKQKKIIELKEIETSRQKQIIEEKQTEILDSIKYASRIQKALITSEKYIQRKLEDLIKK